MKKSLCFLFGFTVFLLSITLTNIPNVEASSTSTTDLIEIDTSIVPAAYELEVFVNKNDSNNEGLVVWVDNQVYQVVNGKLVQSFEPIFMPRATEGQQITLKNNGVWYSKDKFVGKGTNVHTGSNGPAELREHTISNSKGVVLSSIRASAGSIGCQKNVTADGYYEFAIRNLSSATLTWNWTVTF